MSEQPLNRNRAIKEPIQGPIPRKTFQRWLEGGTEPLRAAVREELFVTLLKIPGAEDFDLLFGQTAEYRTATARDQVFRFCGLYDRKNLNLHLAGEPLCKAVKDLREQEQWDETIIRKDFIYKVNVRVQLLVGNDRSRFSVREISSPFREKNLADYREHGARSEAIRLCFAGKMPDTCFRAEYQAQDWSEKQLFSYLRDPKTLIQAEAHRCFQEDQERILEWFLRNDALQTAYQKLLADTEDPVCRKIEITRAVSDCGAKAVSVSIRKNGVEMTFRVSANGLKGDRSIYSVQDITASDRRTFKKIYRSCCPGYTVEDILRITYGRNTIYEAPIVQKSDLAEGQGMGGMCFG